MQKVINVSYDIIISAISYILCVYLRPPPLAYIAQLTILGHRRNPTQYILIDVKESRELQLDSPYGFSSFWRACILSSLPCSSRVTVVRLTSQMLPWKICARSLNSPRCDALHLTFTSMSSREVAGTSERSVTYRWI